MYPTMHDSTNLRKSMASSTSHELHRSSQLLQDQTGVQANRSSLSKQMQALHATKT